MGDTSQAACGVLPDEALARRAATGDPQAFTELERRYEEPLSLYATRLLGDTGAGRRAARVALRAARRALHGGTLPATVRPWLYRITLTAAIDLRVRVEGDETARPRLPERVRRAFVLREVYGLSVGEIAVHLDLSRSQVERALFAARRQLSGRIAPTRSPSEAREQRSSAAARPALRGRRLAAAAAAVAIAVLVPVTGALVPSHGAPPSSSSRPTIAVPPADRAL